MDYHKRILVINYQTVLKSPITDHMNPNVDAVPSDWVNKSMCFYYLYYMCLCLLTVQCDYFIVFSEYLIKNFQYHHGRRSVHTTITLAHMIDFLSLVENYGTMPQKKNTEILKGYDALLHQVSKRRVTKLSKIQVTTLDFTFRNVPGKSSKGQNI